MKANTFLLRFTFLGLFVLIVQTLTAQEKMKKAYELANSLVRERLAQESAENIAILDNIGKSDIIVVDGTYDHIHLVLESLKIPFVSISSAQVMAADLQPHQTVFVNCASSFPTDAARKLATFVQQGGQLITTDWALKNVLEVAFPNTVAFNEKATADEVVRIEVIDKTDELVKGFLDEKSEPVWWLEGSSYPIRILNKEKVKVLIRSKELQEKYGDEGVIIRFEHGEGVVYHMISHFYLQRTETRDQKQKGSAGAYFKDKGASGTNIKLAEEAEDITYGEVQSANTSADFVSRAVVNQAKRTKNRKK
jgi:hypothetical protein